MKYVNGTKETWRGWVWNRIAERLPPGSTVMVLCGDAGLDVATARKKGFVPVGVDIVQECVDTFEKSGGLAVKDKIHRQIAMFRPDAVILDELGGISGGTFGNVMYAVLAGCRVIAGNWMRGRDPIGKELRERFSMWIKYLPRDQFSHLGHRGKLAWLNLFMAGIQGIQDKCDEFDIDMTEDVIGRAIARYAAVQRVAFYSYQSQDCRTEDGKIVPVWFDSAVWSWNKPQTNLQWELSDTARMRKSRQRASDLKQRLAFRRGMN